VSESEIQKPDSMSDRFIIIKPALIGAGGKLDFNIYVNTDNAGRILALQQGQLLSRSDHDRLVNSGRDVYVSRRDFALYQDHIETRLARMLKQDVSAEAERLGELVYEASHGALRQVCERPEKINLIKARRVINHTARVIMRSDAVLRVLLQLARHDMTTFTHSCNVGIFGLGLVGSFIKSGQRHDPEELGAAFFFHDLGKLSVSRPIIAKPGPLSTREWEHMRQHPVYGERLLRKFGLLNDKTRRIVLIHHERLDGSGYPSQLHAADIGSHGRMLAVVDVYDALTSERSYRPRATAIEALTMMQSEMRHLFDQEVMKRFITLMAPRADKAAVG